jgi:hypothetical protein
MSRNSNSINRRLVGPIVLISLAALLAIRFVFIGSEERESRSFRSYYDLNKDGDVSRLEWFVHTQKQGIESGEFVKFEVADCDSNGRLTWMEYREAFLKAGPCKQVSPYRDLEDRSRPSGSLPFLLEANIFDKIESSSTNWIEVMISSTLSYPQGMYEAVLGESTIGMVTIQCSKPKQQQVKINLDASTGIYPIAACSLANADKGHAVTMVLIEITLADSKFHIVKPIYLSPGSEEQYRLLLPPGDAPKLGVKVISARGMPVGPM